MGQLCSKSRSETVAEPVLVLPDPVPISHDGERLAASSEDGPPHPAGLSLSDNTATRQRSNSAPRRRSLSRAKSYTGAAAPDSTPSSTKDDAKIIRLSIVDLVHESGSQRSLTVQLAARQLRRSRLGRAGPRVSVSGVSSFIHDAELRQIVSTKHRESMRNLNLSISTPRQRSASSMVGEGLTAAVERATAAVERATAAAAEAEAKAAAAGAAAAAAAVPEASEGSTKAASRLRVGALAVVATGNVSTAAEEEGLQSRGEAEEEAMRATAEAAATEAEAARVAAEAAAAEAAAAAAEAEAEADAASVVLEEATTGGVAADFLGGTARGSRTTMGVDPTLVGQQPSLGR